MKKLFLSLLSVFITTFLFSQTYIPQGVDPEYINDNTVKYELKGWSFIGKDNGGNEIDMPIASISISCTCNNSSGNCMPFIAKGGGGSTSGCAGGCTNCTKSAAITPQGGGKEIEVLSGGLYSPSEETVILDPNQENIMPAVFEDLLKSEKFIAEYNKFTSRYTHEQEIPAPIINADGIIEAPTGYSFYYISIYGRALLSLLPNNDDIITMTPGGKASCSCSKGNCTVKSQSVPFVGSVTYCEGDCSGTCTLSAIANPKPKLTIQTYE